MPSLGVILTTYNGREFLPEQLDSLLAQTGVELHIYAFDDCSTDGTMSVLLDYAERYPGTFTIAQNTPNSGGTGLNIFGNVQRCPSHHDFVALADQDDVWLPEKLSRAVAELTRTGASLYFSNLLAWDGGQQILGVVTKTAPFQAHDHLFGGGSAGCTYVLTQSFFRLLQDVISATDLAGVRRISHDWIIYFLARHYGLPVVASADALIKYRVHASSQYGGMSQGGAGAAVRKLRLVQAGFLREQIDNALLFAREGTEDYEILTRCTKGRLDRLAVLATHRFSLVRSKSRLAPLAVALLGFK